MRAVLNSVLSVVAVLVLMGCNTVEGVGKDIKKGGEAIERAADKAK